MYHSVTFVVGGSWHPVRPASRQVSVNTWNDWHLIPTSRPVISPPGVRTEYVDLPIADGELDLTEELNSTAANAVNYSFREGSIEFMVENGFKPWFELNSEIHDILHGQYCRMFLEDEPNVWYEGRVSIKEWRSDKHWSYLTFDYKLKPERFQVETGNEDDPGENSYQGAV